MMHRLLATALVLLGAFSSTTVSAQLPDPPNSSLDGDVMLGNARGGAVPFAPNLRATITDGYRVVVRDQFNNPISGVSVIMNFAGTDVRVHANQTGGQIAHCANEIRVTTKADGVAIFFPATVGVYDFTTPEVRIRAGSILLGSLRFRSLDLVAAPGGESKVDAQDLAAFRLRMFGMGGESPLDPETDYATEGPSAGQTDAFDANVLRSEILCGTLGFPVTEPCAQPVCN